MGKVQLADFVLSINPLFSWTWIGILPVSPHPFPKSQCDGARVAWGLLAHGGQGLQRVWNQLATPCQPWALAPPKQGPLWMLTGCSLNLIACLGSHGASVVKVCWALQPERADERESASHMKCVLVSEFADERKKKILRLCILSGSLVFFEYLQCGWH